jgi:hypothetical protein
MYFNELKQLAEELGNPRRPKKINHHHPVSDAKWAKEYYEQLEYIKRHINE